MLLPGTDGLETQSHHPHTTAREAPSTEFTYHSTTQTYLQKASAIALTAIIHLILAFVSKHHKGLQAEAILLPTPIALPLSYASLNETLSQQPTNTIPPSAKDATYQTGLNAFIVLTPLRTLTRNIGPCQEMGEFPSLTGVEMLPEARYAVDLLPLLSHHKRHHVITWHLYCDGSYYKASSKHEETCAMAIVVVGEVSIMGESNFYLADIIAAELEEHDIQYVGASQKGPDIAEAMAVHWASIWILCFANTPQTADVHYDSTSAGNPAEGLYSAGPNIEVVARATRGIVHTLEQRTCPSLSHTSTHTKVTHSTN